MGCIVARSSPKGSNSANGSDQSFGTNSVAEDTNRSRKETECVAPVDETHEQRMPPRAVADFSWLTSNYIAPSTCE